MQFFSCFWNFFAFLLEMKINFGHCTFSVLDLTVQLIEKGTGDDLVCALVIFLLRYVFVNHLHVKYKLNSGHWKVTSKVWLKVLVFSLF